MPTHRHNQSGAGVSRPRTPAVCLTEGISRFRCIGEAGWQWLLRSCQGRDIINKQPRSKLQGIEPKEIKIAADVFIYSDEPLQRIYTKELLKIVRQLAINLLKKASRDERQEKCLKTAGIE